MPKVMADPGEVVLKAVGVSVSNRLKEISFELRKGEVLGIAGLMGAGRTRLARTLFGAEKIEHGHVYINGEEVELKSPKDAILAGIGLVTDRSEERRVGQESSGS